MADVTLENRHLRTVVDPDQGCGLLAFAARRGSDWLPLLPDVHLGLSELRAASFLMVPYSNRIENGRFTFQGRAYQLEGAERHAIHGDVRGRPWQTEERTPVRLVCTFDSRHHERINWPWPFAVRAEFEVRERALAQRLALWNRGETAMPAGCGWHPYFNRQLTAADDEVRLRFGVEGAYPDARGTRIPSGPPQPLTPSQDFGAGKSLAPDNFLDTCCCGYDGGGHIRWPGSGVRLAFQCSPACSHLILYNPGGTPHFAVEPVTNANDGVNLLDAGEPTAGTTVLEPGACLEAEFALTVELE